MATPAFTSDELQQLHDLAKQWAKIVSRRAFGEFGTRVKGRQKHWTRPDGAESILQLRAAVLSEDGRLERHFAHRPGCAFRKRHRPASPEPQTAN